MARVALKQNTFNRGVISAKLHGRVDLELYYTALANGSNGVVDGRGILEKRPGTRYCANTKNNGRVELVPFVYSVTQAYMLEFGHQYVRAFANYGHVIKAGDPTETVTPYTASEIGQLSFTQSNDVLFIAHPSHKPARLARTAVDTFTLASFDTFDGPYDDPNSNPDHKLGLSGTTLTATGFAPFTNEMVGRWVRIRVPNTDSPDPGELGDEFLWEFMQITAFTSSTVVTVDHNATIAATMDWRLGSFYGGRWPSQVAMHDGRLILSRGNRVYMSKPYDYNNFAPTQHAVHQHGATNRVLADNAIQLILDTGLSQSGAIAEALWIRSLNYQLVVGTPAGEFTIQSSSLGEGLDPETVTVRFQDARGASRMRPATVSDSLLFGHATGRRLQGTYYKQGGLDRLGMQDLSLPFDTFITAPFRQIAWQDYPHGVVWGCLEDGRVVSLSLQPEEQVQGWMPHRLGGRFDDGGLVEHPHVECLAVIPSPDGKKNDLWMVVRRTVNGQEVRFVEVMHAFREAGEDVRDSWFLDAALRYEGNTDPGKTLAITVPEEGPNVDWEITTNFADPAFEPQQKLSVFDGERWHRGTVIEVDEDNNITWRPAAPNAPAGPADGARWDYMEWLGEWGKLEEGELLIDPRTGAWLQNPSYVEPRRTANISRWSIAVSALAGLDHLEGEKVRALVDGIPTNELTIVDGELHLEGEGCVILVGLPYEHFGELLPSEGGSMNGASGGKQRPAYEVDIDVFETYGLEAGTGRPSSAGRTWAHYKELTFGEQLIEGEPPILETGLKRHHREQQGDQTQPVIAWRHRLPLPCTIRGVIGRFNTSDGR